MHGAVADGVIRLPANEQSGAKKSYRVIGAPTIMQLLHCNRNPHPPQYLGRHQLDSHMPNLPHGPISHYLSSFTARYIRGTGHPLLNSTLSPHAHNQPSHPPLNTPLTYGVIILPTGRRASSCHITRDEWGRHKTRPQHVEWNLELEPAPNSGASHNGPLS